MTNVEGRKPEGAPERRQIDASRLHGEGYRKLWARLRYDGTIITDKVNEPTSPIWTR